MDNIDKELIVFLVFFVLVGLIITAFIVRSSLEDELRAKALMEGKSGLEVACVFGGPRAEAACAKLKAPCK